MHRNTLLLTLVLTTLLVTPSPAASMEAAPPPPSLLPVTAAAPATSATADDFGGGPIEAPQDLTTEAERAALQADVEQNIARLEAAGHLPMSPGQAVTFEWPLRAAANLTDYGYHGVSGFMDHNPAINALLDYTCGERTYDMSGYNHRGSDFFTYPFPWYKMDHSQVEIVAAAPGTLVFKRDGGYDRQCAMTGALSNAVVIRHADSSIAWYLHMKKGSVTTKPVGSAIATGEYLGVVGSSGSSTGPHLHFEVRNADNESLDPFHGECSTAPSLWVEQPPYYDSAVIAVHTGSAPPYRPPCPQQETTNIQGSFEPEDTVTFVTTYRDQLAGQTSTYRILKPDGSLYRTWTHASAREHYTASYWYWTKELDGDGPPPTGTWRFRVDFEGKTYETRFDVGESSFITPTGTITVTHPNGGEAWPSPSLLPITWQDDLEGDVAIDLYAGGIFHSKIVTATRSDGVHFWGTGSSLDPRTDYTVRITDLTDPLAYDTSDEPFTIAPTPTATFTLAPNTGVAPLTVTFTHTSTSMINDWRWDFGDGITATLQSPVHTYTSTGAYTVTLDVSGPTGSVGVTITNAITVTPPPLVTDFSATPLFITPVMTVTFADRSSGPPTDRWLWGFGDGITDTRQHPTHVYTQTGTYTVTLTTGAGDDYAQAMKPHYVRVVERLWYAYLPVIIK